VKSQRPHDHVSLAHVPPGIAVLAAIASFVIGVHWGTNAAGGSDSSCYLNQARLFSRFTTHIEQPLIDRAFWTRAEWTFAPAGHIPSPVRRDFIVPMCPPGLPLVMTAARALRGEFLIVPLCGALTVWLTFVLGRRIDDARTGAAAAVLVASSPIFLYQVVQPMTDVPATAWWLLAVVLAVGLSEGRRRPLASGLAAGLALLTRPNLLALAAVIAAYLVLAKEAGSARVRRIRDVMWFAAGVAPGVALLAALQTAMYGSPLATGYGAARDLFQASHVADNFGRYARWLVTTHTPAILAAVAAPLFARHRALAWLCLAAAGATITSYLPYYVFDDWSYLRFLLPAIPMLVVAAVTGGATALRRLAPDREGVLLAVLTAVLATLWIATARERSAFNLAQLERHFVEAGTYAAERLPAGAAVVTVLHSGAVQYYSQRTTVSWDTLPADSLDRVFAFLRTEGQPAVLMFDVSEEQPFRVRFQSTSVIGRLDWPPAARIGRTVRVYDPADRARYFAGDRIDTIDWPPDRRPPH